MGDRTGIIYEVEGPRDNPSLHKWTALVDGEDSEKGLKIEWSTLYEHGKKGTTIIVGSHGDSARARTLPVCTVSVKRHNPLFQGIPEVINVDLLEAGQAYKNLADATFPHLQGAPSETGGYLIHESARYST